MVTLQAGLELLALGLGAGLIVGLVAALTQVRR